MSLLQPKYLVLILLVVQNTCLVLLMRYSRTRPGTMYLGSTAVCCDEAMKLITCLGILAFTYLNKMRKDDGSGSYTQLNSSNTNDDDIESDIVDKEDEQNKTEIKAQHESFIDYLKDELQFDFRMAGLAGLYTVQKNILYVAVSNLDAAVFQVTYQAKILTTALFSVLLLKRRLSSQKMIGLFILFVGVATVQLDKVEANASKSHQEQHRMIGVLAVLGACCTSGFGGVYFELVLKPQASSNPRPPPSVWAKNVQLSMFAFIIAFITAHLKDGHAIMTEGFFQGYSPLVVLVITFEAMGGLVVAVVIKYADNILKSFATAVSIVTSTIVSAYVFDFHVSQLFITGCGLVFLAIGMYSRKEEAEPKTATSPARKKQPLPQQMSDIAMVSGSSGAEGTLNSRKVNIV